MNGIVSALLVIIIIMNTEKSLFIVGGSSGIGKETAKLFLSKGYRVTNLSRGICDIGGVENLLCDVTDPKYEEVLQDYRSRTSGLSVLVYSAGFSMAAPLEYALQTDYRYLYEVNFFGYLTTLKTLLPLLKRSCGVSCVIGSIGGIIPIAYDAFYSSSKAAVNMLTAALDLELAPQGVRAISVMPGGTKTDFSFKRKILPYEEAKEYADDMAKAVESLKRTEQSGMAPSRVAKTVYRKCVTACASHTFASGCINKAISLAYRLLPQFVIEKIAEIKYFGN